MNLVMNNVARMTRMATTTPMTVPSTIQPHPARMIFLKSDDAPMHAPPGYLLPSFLVLPLPPLLACTPCLRERAGGCHRGCMCFQVLWKCGKSMPRAA